MAHRHLHSAHKKLQSICPWYFLVAAAVCGLICVYSLRQNNLTMIRLRGEVFAADKSGSNVERSLKSLQKHIYSHMNTNLSSNSNVHPPIQLKYTYERLVQAEKARVSTANSQIYTQAQTVCQQQIPEGASGRGRIPCIDEYVTNHGGETEQSIPATLYQFDFASPGWTPDAAGLSMVVGIVLFGLFCIRWGLERIVRHHIKQQL